MGIFGDIEGAAENAAGQGLEGKLIQEGTQKAEQFAEEKTGGRFDSEIQAAGNFADQQIDQRFGGQQGQQDQNQFGGQDQNQFGGQGQQDQFGQDQNQQQNW